MAKVTRVYDTQQKATGAAAALKEKGFTEDQVTVGADAAGSAMVEVAAPFGRAAEAEATLNSFGPIASPAAAPAAAVAIRTEDDPAPLSRALGLSVLSPFKSGIALNPDPAPLSTKFGWKLLTTDKPKAELMPDWTLSGKLGWKLLSDDAAPLSSAAGHKTLSDDPAPLSRAIGWPMLSKDPTPLSSKFGWKVLSDRQ